jgi:uncharacterized RDD family membrane protein YckC
LALLVDVVTVLFVNLGLVLIGGAALVDRAVDRWSPEPWGDSFVPTLVYAALFLVYETAFVVARGQTPGMDLLHLKVVVTATGEHPRLARAIVRTVPLVALRLVPGALAGTLAMLALGVTCPFDRQRRALHDLLVGTVVIDYDADDEDDAAGPIDRDELAATYGPRRLVDLIKRVGK